SSGTTGIPKCIVHGAGGTLLQHTKEHLLHGDLRPADNLVYFTTCGWMMWNWLASALFTGCTVTLFDGSPTHPTPTRMWELVATEGITHFGTSAKFLASCRDKMRPRDLGLHRLRVIMSTGSPLLPEDFDWVYRDVATDVQLSSISGGTDIISCFVLGAPTLPVFRGEIQCLGLGMDVVAMDETDTPRIGEKGELVCRKPFPSMPVAFLDDPDGEKYRRAYFDRIAGMWCHGDFIAVTGSQGSAGGVVVYGRSDATLKPGGVRIGTAEIYRLVETLPEVEDSIVIGQPWEGDVRVVLFVKPAAGVTFDADLATRIKAAIRAGATPRHVPALVLPVDKIPYTRSGKKMELAVLEVVCGREPKNKEAMQDASALAAFRPYALATS
ncbi:MAG TPA: acetoacetate--CoA ligase, partial [Myxococcota bacterium]|nr:acetoacetate--CoA ligase [Myxococcota bacterium]